MHGYREGSGSGFQGGLGVDWNGCKSSLFVGFKDGLAWFVGGGDAVGC